jgi:hypothetical protein
VAGAACCGDGGACGAAGEAAATHSCRRCSHPTHCEGAGREVPLSCGALSSCSSSSSAVVSGVGSAMSSSSYSRKMPTVVMPFSLHSTASSASPSAYVSGTSCGRRVRQRRGVRPSAGVARVWHRGREEREGGAHIQGTAADGVHVVQQRPQHEDAAVHLRAPHHARHRLAVDLRAAATARARAWAWAWVGRTHASGGCRPFGARASGPLAWGVARIVPDGRRGTNAGGAPDARRTAGRRARRGWRRRRWATTRARRGARRRRTAARRTRRAAARCAGGSRTAPARPR